MMMSHHSPLGRTVRAAAILFLAAWGIGAQSPRDALDPLGWLAGAWSSESQGFSSEEHWIAPKGGLMLGVNRTVRPDGRSFFEYLRIQASADGIVYVASPGGRGATEFRMTDSGADWAAFENPDHDFPQKITYRRRGDRLTAEIGGDQSGVWKTQTFEWSRQR